MFAETHFGMLSLGGFLFQNALTFNILQKHHPPTPLNLKGSADSKIVYLLNINNLRPSKSADPTARNYGTPESPSTRNIGEEAYQGRRAHEPKGAQYQQVIITARAEPPQKWRVGADAL